MVVSVATRPTQQRLEKIALEPRGVDKVYDTGKLQMNALREVSFAVCPGEMVAILLEQPALV